MNKKILVYGGVGVVTLVAGFFAYNKWKNRPKNSTDVKTDSFGRPDMMYYARKRKEDCAKKGGYWSTGGIIGSGSCLAEKPKPKTKEEIDLCVSKAKAAGTYNFSTLLECTHGVARM